MAMTYDDMDECTPYDMEVTVDAVIRTITFLNTLLGGGPSGPQLRPDAPDETERLWIWFQKATGPVLRINQPSSERILVALVWQDNYFHLEADVDRHPELLAVAQWADQNHVPCYVQRGGGPAMLMDGEWYRRGDTLRSSPPRNQINVITG